MKRDTHSIPENDPSNKIHGKSGMVARAVYDVTHDLSNQLAIILGSAEMLETHVTDHAATQTALDSRQVTKRVNAVLSSVQKCVELLDRMRSVYWNLINSSTATGSDGNRNDTEAPATSK